jgi:DNA-binding MarR family transcriptional regulator
MNHRVPTPVEPDSIDTVYNVFGKSEQKVYGNSEQMAAEKYARLPDSVLYDRHLSPAARCVYGVLARHAYQGTTARIGQRRIARLLGMHLGTVNASIHKLERYGHIVINGAGKTRRIYHLTSSLFGQKQRAGIEEVIGSPSGVPRLAASGHGSLCWRTQARQFCRKSRKAMEWRWPADVPR